MISTEPAVIVGSTRIVGGDVVAFSFIVDADSYDPDTSPASYAAALAEEMGPQFSEGGGGFGQINLVFGSSTRLRYTFVFGGTKGTKVSPNPTPNPKPSLNPNPNPNPHPNPNPNINPNPHPHQADVIALTLFNWNLYDIGISGITDAAHAEHPELMGMVMIDSSDQGFTYTLPADAKLGTNIVVHESGNPNPNPNLALTLT